MDESEIRRQCKITWAVNYGSFSSTHETGSPPKRYKVDKSGVVVVNKQPKYENAIQRKYIKSLKCTGTSTRRAPSNSSRICKGLEAGKMLSNIEAGGVPVKVWVYLAYREDTLERKVTAFNFLSAYVTDQYMRANNLGKGDYKRISVISAYQLTSMLNQHDKRYPNPTSENIKGYKQPRNFKFRNKQAFYDIEQIYIGLDEKAKAGAKK